MMNIYVTGFTSEQRASISTEKINIITMTANMLDCNCSSNSNHLTRFKRIHNRNEIKSKELQLQHIRMLKIPFSLIETVCWSAPEVLKCTFHSFSTVLFTVQIFTRRCVHETEDKNIPMHFCISVWKLVRDSKTVYRHTKMHLSI